MNIKGHARIELKNIKTGAVEVYEEDNMITNALDKFCMDFCMLGANAIVTDNSLRNNPIAELMGGLLLLDTALTENADNYILPGGVKMIGNGAYEVTADGADGVTELGSWSSTESGWTNDGKFRMVWDFSTTQANTPQGKSIACVCLTSANHGYIGEGNLNSTGASRTTKRSDYSHSGTPQEYNIDENTNSLNRILKITATDSTVTYVANNNYNYNPTYADQHMSQTGKLKVITQKIPFTRMNLRESYPRNNNGGDVFIPTTETEITLPSAFLTQLGTSTPWLGGKHGNYYYLLAKTIHGLAVGASVQGVKIDLANLTATGFTITNTLDDTIYMNNNREACVMFGNGLAAVKCTYGATQGNLHEGFFFQNLSNNADTTFVDNTNMTSNTNYKEHMHEDWCVFNSHKIDFTDRTVLPVNGGDAVTMGAPLVMENPLIEDFIPYNNGYWTPANLRLFRCTDYLATINNLQEPVQKTAEKTMKVTYTISFNDGE